eukprot:9630326-Alexandrium_andersonii.AAC.1
MRGKVPSTAAGLPIRRQRAPRARRLPHGGVAAACGSGPRRLLRALNVRSRPREAESSQHLAPTQRR